MNRTRRQFRTSIGFPDIQKAVLQCLIERRELSKYELSKIVEHAYSAIYKAMKLLSASELVEIARKEPNQRNSNIEVEYYRIAPLGIIRFLRYSTAELDAYCIGTPSPSYSLVDDSDGKWRSLLSILFDNHNYLFPDEFQKLSREFALVASADYCYCIGTYSTQAESELSSQKSLNDWDPGRDWMASKFLYLIEMKTKKSIHPQMKYFRSVEEANLQPGARAYIKRVCQLMSEEDLRIIVDMVENATISEKEGFEKYFKEVNLILTYLTEVKSTRMH